MSQTLESLLRRKKPPDSRAIDRFIASNEFPLVDETGVTFVYRGKADEVRLQHWIYGLPSNQPLERLEGTDLWHLRIELPESSRIEYKFDVVNGEHNHWIVDPLNPRIASDPFGANSVCPGYGYRQPQWTLPDPSAHSGRFERLALTSHALGGRREVAVYLPARFRKTRRYPLLIIHDGPDFQRYGSLSTVLDNLVHRLEVSPMIVALIEAKERNREYAADPHHARFLTEELMPLLEETYPLVDGPEGRGLLGASFGAVASLHAAWKYPRKFGSLILLSGSFAFSDIGRHRRGASFDPVVRFVNEFRRRPTRPAERVYVSCGIYESLIYENRSLVPLLQRHGMEVRFSEVRDGHNWENWRDRMQDGLSWLCPGPLWMVYE